MRVDFIIPGFSKCGTTSLCYLLNQHPDIFLPLKEADFFGSPGYYHHWDVYESMFSGAKDSQLIGENSSRYTSFKCEQLACEQIREHFPDVKLIFLARDPVSRIESSFREMHHRGPEYGFNTPYDLYQALEELPSIVEDARYWHKLSLYRKKFPDEQIKVVFLEDLQARQEESLGACFSFLGVDPDVRIDSAEARLNSAETKLYDSRLLRAIRSNRWTGIPLSKIPVPRQNRILSKIGMRKSSLVPIHWTPEAKRLVHDVLSADSDAFLRAYGKRPDFWPRLQELQ